MISRMLAVAAVVSLALAESALAQDNHIDVVSPLAPELASYGKYAIGVRTVQVTDKNRPEIGRASCRERV